jgi:DNA-binding response OmpR family regulator
VTDATSRILVVDDYAPSRYAFRRILTAGGFEVVEGCDAADARAALHQSVNLVIADVNLPDTSGMELCREIRAARPDLPVLLISASYRSAEHETAWRAAGAADFLEQPVDAEHLLSVVRRLIT